MARTNGIRMSQVRAANDKLVKLLEKASTQEPRSGAYGWVSGSRENMAQVVTFKTEGRNKGSLERFCEANKVPKKVYEALVQAAKYGAHSQAASRGILTFEVSERNLDRLEQRLNAIYESRDKDKNGVLDAKEQAAVKKLKNGKATLEALDKIKSVKTRSLRRELKFSRQVNYVMDLLYSRGSINGERQVEQIAAGLGDAEAKAVRQAYASVSRYISRGRTNKLGFICRDQRREVQRGLMRCFGAGRDATELAISALRLPRAYA